MLHFVKLYYDKEELVASQHESESKLFPQKGTMYLTRQVIMLWWYYLPCFRLEKEFNYHSIRSKNNFSDTFKLNSFIPKHALD